MQPPSGQHTGAVTATDGGTYGSSKAAVVGITRSWAHVLAPRRTRVNAILPGIIDTPTQDRVLEDAAPLRGMTLRSSARRG